MWPRLFEIPVLGWPVNSYGVAIMVGFLLAMSIVARRAPTVGVKRDTMLEIGLVSILFGILGGKLNYLAQYPGDTLEPGKLSVFGDARISVWGAVISALLPLPFWVWRRPASIARRAQIASLVLVCALSAFIGGRAVHLLGNHVAYSWRFLSALRSGFVLYGGLMAGTLAGIVYTKVWKKLPAGRVMDLAAAPTMLALAFGRLGCFLTGCCYGREGQGFPRMSFPPGSPAASDQGLTKTWSRPVHPSQLYEAIAALALFGILSWAWRRRRPPEGTVFLLMAMLYAAWRFTAEFLRGDSRPMNLGLSYSQWVGVAVMLSCLSAMLFIRSGRPGPPRSDAMSGP